MTLRYDDILKVIYNSIGPQDMAHQLMRKLDHETANLQQKIICLENKLKKVEPKGVKNEDIVTDCGGWCDGICDKHKHH